MSSERPIIFSGDMVRAVLDGRKTQTRRTRGLDYINKEPDIWESLFFNLATCSWAFLNKRESSDVLSISIEIRCPYGKVGDLLWVKETVKRNIEHSNFYYSTDNKGVGIECYRILRRREKPYPKTISSRFMPKWAARIWLEITNIRVERVQDISKEDVKAEGVIIRNIGETYWRAFHSLWDSLNAKRGFGWDKNPFVWVIEFKRIVK